MKIFSLACLVAGAFTFAIGFGYVYYVVVLGGRAYPIPTISKTWTFEPSNFISRQVVIPGSVALMIIHVAIYYSVQQRPGASVLLLIALVANAALAVVSSICMDDHSAECLGSVRLHDDFAVAYFTLIDFWMAGMEILVSRKSWHRSVLCLLNMLVSVRYFAPGTIAKFGLSDPFEDFSLGEFEWFNVTTILLYTISFVYEHVSQTQVGILGLDDPVAPTDRGNTRVEPLLSVANGSLTLIAIIMCIATIGLAFSVAAARKDFQPLPHVPEVSDLFVLPPGNIYAHFGGVLGSTVLSIVLVQFSYAYRSWAIYPRFPLACSLMGTFCLSMSLCVSKMENTDLHFFFVSGFFAWFQVFIIWVTFLTQQGKTVPKQAKGWMTVTALLSLLSKARFAIWDLEPFAVCELFDIVTIIVFVGSFAWFHSVALKERPFALFNVIENGHDGYVDLESAVVSKATKVQG